jgi:hypothetical protein
MKPFPALMLFVLPVLLAATAVPAPADPANEQGEVREQRKAGHVRPLRQIEQLILPRMKGKQYLGPEYDPIAMAYRLKFIEDGKVEFIDVDARSAKILKHSR